MVFDEQRLPRVYTARWSKTHFIPLPEGGAEDAHDLGVKPRSFGRYSLRGSLRDA
jgi:hypothetical protein